MHKHRKSKDSLRQSNHKQALIPNQQHPFQPNHSGESARKNRENLPYQSIKKGVPTINNEQKYQPSFEMTANNIGITPEMTGMFRQNPQPQNNQNAYNYSPAMQPQNPQFIQPQNITSMPPQNPQIAQPPNLAMMAPQSYQAMQPQATPLPYAPQMIPPMPMQMAPSPVPMQYQIQPNSLNPNINQQMAVAGQNFFQSLGGWGTNYYNALDPVLAAKKNTPMPVPPSKHILILIMTIIMIGGIVVAIIGLNKFLQLYMVAILIAAPFLLYIGITFCCSQIRGYIFNLKKFDQYQNIYNTMKLGKGYFTFFIQCYHYSTTRSKKGGSTRKKVVTHTARQQFNPRQCIDDSGEVEGLKIVTQYAFCKYLKRFYFTDPGSEARFISAFNQFVSRNRRDTHQNYSYNFEITGFQEEVGFCATGDSGHSKVLFLVFMFLGLAFPYSLFLEKAVSRFQINILKRLSV